jgi:two-component system, cell cycle sensor histidine kinase and response regulator CckA
MQVNEKTREQLIDELELMRLRVEHLEQTQDRKEWQKTFDLVPDFIALIDTQHHILRINKSMELRLGLAPQDAIGKKCYEIIHGSNKPPDFCPHPQTMKDGKDHVVEMTEPRLGGSFLVSTSPMLDKDNRVTGCIHVARDISALKVMEGKLRDSEQRYRTLFDTAGDAIYLIDAEGENAGRIVSANPAAAAMNGYTVDELLTLRISDLDTPEWAEKVPERIGRVLRGETLKGVVTHRRKDGTTFPLEISAKLVVLGDHKYVMAIDRDITDRETAARALRKSEERYHQLCEVSFEGIFFHDRGVLIEANDQYFEMFGYARDELLGTQVIEKTVSSESLQPVWSHVLSGSIEPYEAVGLKKDGSKFPIEINIKKSTVDGRDIRAGSIRDLSNQKKLEAELLQAQKMEAVGTLAGGIAHDFNNLLQAIMGFTELLILEKTRTDSERESLQKIYDSGRRGADLVRSLLTFSRKVEPELYPVDLDCEIVLVQELLYRTIPKTIKIDLHLSGKPARVMADKSQMGQILVNLGVNARDAMPDGGTLTIETANLQLDKDYCDSFPEVKPGHYVLITVSDSGHGMDKETLEHIFDPFFTTKEVGKGTGLGLATVYGIVKHHGGHINCYSEPGCGTTFKIYLPAVQTDKEPKIREEEIPIRGGNETILLVDDEDFIRDIGSKALNRSGYHVITASDGQEALDVYRREGDKISLVILDLIMPEMDGKKCLNRILEINPKAKVLMASGYSEHGPSNASITEGAVGFVVKPYDIRKLRQTVRKVLDHD